MRGAHTFKNDDLRRFALPCGAVVPGCPVPCLPVCSPAGGERRQDLAPVVLHSLLESVPAGIDILQVEQGNGTVDPQCGSQLQSQAGFSGAGKTVDAD